MISAFWLRVGAAGLAVALLAGVALSIYNKGKTAGRVEGAAEQLQLDRQQAEQDRAQFLQQLAHYKEQDDAAKAAIAQKETELESLRNSRLVVRNAVAALQPSEVLPDLHKRLGNPGGDGLGLTEQELRHLDTVLADYQNLEAQVAALEAKSASQEGRIDAIEHQRDAAIASYNKLYPLYVKAYNASQKRHSLFVKIITFGLVRDKKMDLPDPVTLEHP